MATIGYARVSTLDQRPGTQTEALTAAGCERVFTDHGVSGARTSRPELDACLASPAG
jgi:DNA invertase Pin-like site-specific DNA recombinase